MRTTGTGRAVAVVALDVAKGAAAVGLAHLASGGAPLLAATGAAAVVGHIYPVWLRFHGGKGVAVAAGVFTVLAPVATAIAVALFVLQSGPHATSRSDRLPLPWRCRRLRG